MSILLRLIIGAVFLYAGGLKAWAPLGFANDIEHFHLLSWTLGMGFAFYLPWLEIICGLALIATRLRIAAVAILTALTAVFLVATILAKLRGINLDCGCFGSASKGWSFGTHLLVDFALLTTLLLIWFRETRVAPVARLSVS